MGMRPPFLGSELARKGGCDDVPTSGTWVPVLKTTILQRRMLHIQFDFGTELLLLFVREVGQAGGIEQVGIDRCRLHIVGCDRDHLV